MDQRDRTRTADQSLRARVLRRADHRCENCGDQPYVPAQEVTGYACNSEPPCPTRNAVLPHDSYCHHEVELVQRLALEIDHVVPWAAGGRTRIDNMQALCNSCHDSKTEGQR